MKKFIQVISTSLMITLVACGQNKTQQQKVEAALDAAIVAAPETQKTEYHVKLPNSSFYVVPPMDFKVDPLSGLLQKNAEKGYIANFLSMEFLAGKTIPEYLAEIKGESEKNFPGIWNEEELEVSGHPAKLIQFQAMKDVVGYQLVFTDNLTNEMLIAYYDAKDEITGGEMRRAIKSAVVEINK